jgi:hypothetical protein
MKIVESITAPTAYRFTLQCRDCQHREQANNMLLLRASAHVHICENPTHRLDIVDRDA